jgi:hypothetical protein
LTLGAATAFVFATGADPTDLTGRAGDPPPAGREQAPLANPTPTDPAAAGDPGTPGDQGDPCGPAGGPGCPDGAGNPDGPAGTDQPGDPDGTNNPDGPDDAREPAPFSVSIARSGATCSSDGTSWTITVTATGSRAIRSATLVWRPAPGASPQRTSLPAGGTSTVSGTSPAARATSIEWWIEATATDSATASASPRTTRTPCRRRANG